MKNKTVKQMICDTESYVRNGCVPKFSVFAWHQESFGYWVLLKSGWFFRGIYLGVVKLDSCGNEID